ncbi:hypothetical protein [Martelella mediterranea]|uniref:Uncharacterized protein n=1 Tax=Martelella mediterranea DSM 17316 TaxID=1122214 RepID=A0A1U9YYW1_9HYPH|nr:hypothetical protein [Martelella mediterranea]AQZ50618.1 hypothetical protein Mame_01250 [Martelella mediterranea DSM 17316]
MTTTKDQLFKPGRVSATDKLATTDKVAREIIAEEATRLVTKTERLRRLRIEREAAAPEEKPKKARAKKAAK